MNYTTPELQIVGSAKTLVRGTQPTGEIWDNPVANFPCQLNLSRDGAQC